MFKTLIATCLFTFSSCTGISHDYQKKDTRQNLLPYGSLYGTYVLRDDFSQLLQEFNDSHEQDSYTLHITYDDYNEDITGLYYYNGNMDIANVDELSISLSTYPSYTNMDITFYVKLNKSDTIYTEIEVPDVPYNDGKNLQTWLDRDYGSNDESVMYHTLYFNGNVNLQGTDYELFNIFYTSLGNAYNTYYTGYYHCINSITWNSFTTFQCQIIVDNVLYSYMSFEFNSWYAIYDFEDRDTIEIYNNGWKIKDMNVYLNGMIPNNIYVMLSAKGTFSYVPPQPIADFSFKDFFFGIADTPLYYAWSLLNWDLFGLNLFVAFCGLCTLALIVFVIKKLI